MSSIFEHPPSVIEYARELVREYNEWEREQLEEFKRHNETDRIKRNRKKKQGGF